MTEKQLNPLGHTGHILIMGIVICLFSTIAGVITSYSDMSNVNTLQCVVWLYIGTALASVFLVHEVYLHQKANDPQSE